MPDSFCWNQGKSDGFCRVYVCTDVLFCRDFSSESWNEKTKSKWGMKVGQVYSRRKSEISCVWVIWFCSHPSNLFRWPADSSSTIIESRNFSDAAIEITTSEKNDSKRVYNYNFLFKASIVHRHKNSSTCITVTKILRLVLESTLPVNTICTELVSGLEQLNDLAPLPGLWAETSFEKSVRL